MPRIECYMSQQARNRYMLLVLVMTGMVAVYALHRDFVGLYQDYREREAEIQALRDRVRGAETQAGNLAHKVEQLDNDAVEMEAAIRRNKNLVREGETIYRVELPPEIESAGAKRSP